MRDRVKEAAKKRKENFSHEKAQKSQNRISLGREARIFYLLCLLCLFAALFVIRELLQMNAAICRHGSNRRAAGAEVERELLRDSTLHSHGKIGSYTTINCPRLDVGRVILRH